MDNVKIVITTDGEIESDSQVSFHVDNRTKHHTREQVEMIKLALLIGSKNGFQPTRLGHDSEETAIWPAPDAANF